MLFSRKTWAALGLLVVLAAACGGESDAPAPLAEDGAAAQGEAVPPQGDCEKEGKKSIAEARALMDEMTPSTGADFKGAAEVCGVDEIEMEVSGTPKGQGTPSAFFAPTVLVGEPGQELTIVATNPDVIAHSFTLDEQGIDEVLQAVPEPGGVGGSAEVKVTFPTDGEPVLFYCKFHKLGGQWGALVTY